MPDTPLLSHEDKNKAAMITLNRPKASNSMNRDLLSAFKNAVQEISQTREIRCLILTGQGEKTFCAGADLKERQGMDEDQVNRFIFRSSALFTTIQRLPIPVIAAINGAALGGGLELALAVAAPSDCQGLSEMPGQRN